MNVEWKLGLVIISQNEHGTATLTVVNNNKGVQRLLVSHRSLKTTCFRLARYVIRKASKGLNWCPVSFRPFDRSTEDNKQLLKCLRYLDCFPLMPKKVLAGLVATATLEKWEPDYTGKNFYQNLSHRVYQHCSLVPSDNEGLL